MARRQNNSHFKIINLMWSLITKRHWRLHVCPLTQLVEAAWILFVIQGTEWLLCLSFGATLHFPKAGCELHGSSPQLPLSWFTVTEANPTQQRERFLQLPPTLVKQHTPHQVLILFALVPGTVLEGLSVILDSGPHFTDEKNWGSKRFNVLFKIVGLPNGSVGIRKQLYRF